MSSRSRLVLATLCFLTTLIAPGLQMVDFYGWDAHAVGTFARCPNGAGAFGDLPGSRGFANC